MGDAALAAAAKAIAYHLDPHAVVDRSARAAEDRTVTIRPAPDTMTYVTALLPVAQGVLVYAALKRQADTTCDGRSRRGRVMADTLVERVTGRPAAQPVPVSVNVVISDRALLRGRERRCRHRRIRLSAVSGGAEAYRVRGEQSRRAGDAASPLRQPGHRRAGGHGLEARAFPRGCPSSSSCVTSVAAPRTATPRPPPGTTPCRIGGAVPPARQTDRVCEGCNYTKEAPGWNVSADSGERGTQFDSPPRPGPYYHSTTAGAGHATDAAERYRGVVEQRLMPGLRVA